MDTSWQSEFRRRMSHFGSPRPDGGIPISIKVRVTSGCFHREHSPHAYRLIDDQLSAVNFDDAHFQFEEHESGPEILVYVAAATAGLSLAKSVIELITTIIKARSEGIKKGDHPSDPIEVIVRGHYRDGEYFEEMIMRISPEQTVSSKQIVEALSKCKRPASQKKKARKKK